MRLYSLNELKILNAIAFNSLPADYQNEDCLHFFMKNGELFALPKETEKEILGDFTVRFNSHSCSWEVGTHKPKMIAFEDQHTLHCSKKRCKYGSDKCTLKFAHIS